MPLFADHPGRILLLAATLPLMTAVILFLLGTMRRLRGADQSPAVATAGLAATLTMALSAACAIIGLIWFHQDLETFAIMPTTFASRWSESFEFLRIGGSSVDHRPSLLIPLGYAIDRLTVLMLGMVTIISTLIFTFSLGYMRDETHRVVDHDLHIERRGRFARFYFYLLLFAFAMLQLLIADNLLQVFAGWELVGTCSFFLIGFYYERPSASRAANKAFIMNRVGDAGFLIGLAILFTHFGTLRFDDLVPLLSSWNHGGLDATLMTVMGLGLFAGCVGKSAQFPLQTWLPDAMEGPTPVSALIHAATMVAAGVYLCARCLPFFTPGVLMVIAWIGAITMVMSAATACVQTDIKRVLAFSTCSQLGLMMLGLAFDRTGGLFHLITHAFFKALLFLGAGSVIHALHHEQDLFKMGGLRKRMPITAYTMLIGVFAIIGLPYFSGWYSKDLILEALLPAQGSARIFPLLAFLTVVLTAYYMMKLWLLVFAGEPRGGHPLESIQESPWRMTIPLIILAIFSTGVAWGRPFLNEHRSLLEHELTLIEPRKEHEDYHRGMEANALEAIALAFACTLLGVAVAFVKHRSRSVTVSTSPIHQLLAHRFYFDRVYDGLIAQSTVQFSRLIGRFDKQSSPVRRDLTLDGALTIGGRVPSMLGFALRPLQAGRVRVYISALGLTAAAGLAILWLNYR